jgi:hypothetical protein
MSSPHAGLEVLILGFPAVGLLFSAFFRLDELIARPNTNSGIGRPLSHRGEDGYFVCIEPDGRASIVEGTGRGFVERKAGYLPRRADSKPIRRVSTEWVGDSADE